MASKYWLYVMPSESWNELKRKILDDDLKIFMLAINELSENDIIFIYQKHKSSIKHGFVADCKVQSKLYENKKKIKCFSDIPMNNFYVKVSDVNMYNNPVKIKGCDWTTNEIKKFKAKYTHISSGIIQIDENSGTLINNMLTSLNEICSSSDSFSEEEDSDIEENGNIPILTVPCKQVDWDTDDIIEEVLSHYKICEKCDKTNNNGKIDILPLLKSRDITFEEIDDEMIIDEYLSYYHNLKKYKELDDIFIYRIRNKNSDYNGCLIILF
jgi:hypothetical protein